MVDPQADKLIERIRQDMRQALKDRDRNTLDELRSLLARISNAEAITPPEVVSGGHVAGAAQGVGSTEAQRKQLSLADVRAIITDEAHEIESSLPGIDQTSDYAAQLREKLTIIQKYL